MKQDDAVIGWRIEPTMREALLAAFPPRYARIVADHVTLAAKVPPSVPLPDAVAAHIVGEADDGAGVQALIVAIDGSPDRPGGGAFHTTWSLAEGHEAKESNDVIAERGWQPFDRPMPLPLVPARLR